jgi:trk system potassium uptake protein TrkH
LLVGAFAAAILAGALLLTLPVSSAGARIGVLDALFTATSAVCVTGLTVRDIGREFSTFGHVVILALIQLGGLGITTLSTAVFLVFGQRASLSTHDMVESSFRARPAGRLEPLLVQVFVSTLVIEAVGAVVLLPAELGRLPPLEAVWTAFFHAVSAFCNAGFSLRSDSLIGDRANAAVILPISGLIILGGLGFGVLTEVGESLRARLGGRRAKRLSLHARLALATTGVLLFTGTVGFWTFESGNLVRDTTVESQILTSVFASVTPRTAGFNSIDYAEATTATIFLTVVLMTIGGCPGSTAGGIKTTTLAVLFATARARLRGRRWASLYGRGVSEMAVDKAIGVVALAMVLVVGGALLLSAIELRHAAHVQTPGRSVGLLFEVVSALGTVGLTTGITPTLAPAGKVLIIVLMFVGRLGPLTVAMAIARREPRPAVRLAEEPIMIG